MQVRTSPWTPVIAWLRGVARAGIEFDSRAVLRGCGIGCGLRLKPAGIGCGLRLKPAGVLSPPLQPPPACKKMGIKRLRLIGTFRFAIGTESEDFAGIRGGQK